jgi:hypothetical protein
MSLIPPIGTGSQSCKHFFVRIFSFVDRFVQVLPANHTFSYHVLHTWPQCAVHSGHSGLVCVFNHSGNGYPVRAFIESLCWR